MARGGENVGFRIPRFLAVDIADVGLYLLLEASHRLVTQLRRDEFRTYQVTVLSVILLPCLCADKFSVSHWSLLAQTTPST